MLPKILYTAIFGDYDKLKPIQLPDNWRALCFTDQDISAEGWETIRLPFRDKIFREVKIRPDSYLPEHDISVWIDSNITVSCDLDKLIEGAEFRLMLHPDRSCIYSEAEACIRLGKDSENVINHQMNFYKIEEYPKNNGLYATGVLIRKNTQLNSKIGAKWLSHVLMFSVRDQLSFPVVASECELKFDTFPFLEGFNKRRHGL